MSTADGVDDRALVLVRWGLRFRDPATEADYDRWNLRGALPMFRAGGLLFILVFIANLPMMRSHWPATWSSGATLQLIGEGSLAGAIAYSYGASLRWMRLIQVCAWLLQGCSGVASLFWFAQSPSMPGNVSANAAFHILFVASLLRFGPTLTMVQAVPVVAFAQVLYVHRFLAGGIDAQLLLAFSATLANTLVLGLLISAAIDRRLRRSYREERIIELQREVIDRLQQSQLRRQVAERAGRLAEVLARPKPFA